MTRKQINLYSKEYNKMTSVTKLTVRYAETDQMGIVYHTNYGIWYEIARTKDIGYSYSDMEKIGILLPVINLNINYISPARYDNNITIKTTVSKISSAKIEFFYSTYIEGDEKTINTGSSIHAFVDKDMKLMNFRKNFPDIYTAIKNSI